MDKRKDEQEKDDGVLREEDVTVLDRLEDGAVEDTEIEDELRDA